MKRKKQKLKLFPYVNYNLSNSPLEKRQNPYISPRESEDFYRRNGQPILREEVIQEFERFNIADTTIQISKNGETKEYHIKYILSKPAVQVLCFRINEYTGKLEICMILEPRCTHTVMVDEKKYARFFWGFPAGLVEKDETMEEGAIREVSEEIGYKLLWMKPLVKNYIHLHISCSTETIGTFVARVGEKTKQHLDEGENIIYRWIPVNDVEQELEAYLEGKKTFFNFDLAEITILLLQCFFTKLHRGDFKEIF